MVMLARTNLRRDDLFYYTLPEIKLIHDQLKKDREEERSQLYNIADLLANWIVKSGDGLTKEFREKNLVNELIPNPYIDPKKKRKQTRSRYGKGYSNRKEAERLLQIWKIEIPK